MHNLHLTQTDENGIPASILGMEDTSPHYMLDLDMTRPEFFGEPCCAVSMEFKDSVFTDHVAAANLPIYCNTEKGFSLWYMHIKAAKELLMVHVPGGTVMDISGGEVARVRSSGRVPFPPCLGFGWLTEVGIPYFTCAEVVGHTAMFGEHRIALNMKNQ